MLEKMALAKGIHFQESLTGFKWMGNIARTLEASYDVPFAFEEALGYMFPKVCHDKDGITAAMIFLSAEAKWRSQGLTPYTKLQKLFEEFGYHETLNNYFRSPSPDVTAKLFKAIRNGPYGAEKKLGSFKILRWRDMTEGYDSGTQNNKPTLPVDKGSQMLTLWLDRGVHFTLRGSGTEPKVKSRFPAYLQINLELKLTISSLHRRLRWIPRRGHKCRLRRLSSRVEGMGRTIRPVNDIQQAASDVFGACF